MGAEECRHRSLGPDRAQRRQLGLAVEPVAGFRLRGRRPGTAHPVEVTAKGIPQALFAGGAGGTDSREDPATRGVELLVARPARAERELVHAVAAEARVRVAIDEAGDRAPPAAVDFHHVAVERRELTHPPHCGDRSALAEDVRVLDDVDAAEVRAAQRRVRSSRRRQLGQIADEQTVRGRRGGHSPPSAGVPPLGIGM